VARTSVVTTYGLDAGIDWQRAALVAKGLAQPLTRQVRDGCQGGAETVLGCLATGIESADFADIALDIHRRAVPLCHVRLNRACHPRKLFPKRRMPEPGTDSGERAPSLSLGSFSGECPPDILLLRKTGARGRNRTADTMIFSHVLYQLSYPGSAAAAVPNGSGERWTAPMAKRRALGKRDYSSPG
jgi:hypothetical protein